MVRDKVLFAVMLTCIAISSTAVLAPIAPVGMVDDGIGSFTITASGNAYLMPPSYYYKGVYEGAELYLECTVTKVTKGVVKFTVDVGSLTVDGEDYVVVVDGGRGNWGSN